MDANSGGLNVAIIVLVIGYFIPTVIAFLRKHKDAPAIAAVNIFLGWSVVGWFVAFIWALSDASGRGHQTVVINTTQHIGPAHPPPQPEPERQRVARSTPLDFPASGVRPAIASPDADTAFWDGMRDKSDPDLLEEYLTRFPAGRFSQLARNRLARAGSGAPVLLRALAGPAAEAACESCGAAWEPDARFCGECGAARG